MSFITNPSTGSGGGTTVYSGTTTLDFGAAPGTNIVTATITGQSLLTGSSRIKAYLGTSGTASHNAYEHMIAPIDIRIGDVVAGTGFTIYASTTWRLTGTFNVVWEWYT